MSSRNLTLMSLPDEILEFIALLLGDKLLNFKHVNGRLFRILNTEKFINQMRGKVIVDEFFIPFVPNMFSMREKAEVSTFCGVKHGSFLARSSEDNNAIVYGKYINGKPNGEWFSRDDFSEHTHISLIENGEIKSIKTIMPPVEEAFLEEGEIAPTKQERTMFWEFDKDSSNAWSAYIQGLIPCSRFLRYFNEERCGINAELQLGVFTTFNVYLPRKSFIIHFNKVINQEDEYCNKFEVLIGNNCVVSISPNEKKIKYVSFDLDWQPHETIAKKIETDFFSINIVNKNADVVYFYDKELDEKIVFNFNHRFVNFRVLNHGLSVFSNYRQCRVALCL